VLTDRQTSLEAGKNLCYLPTRFVSCGLLAFDSVGNGASEDLSSD